MIRERPLLSSAALVTAALAAGCVGGAPSAHSEHAQAVLPPPRVGAFYFGSFSSADNDPQIIDGGLEVYGPPADAWAGVRQFYPNGALQWTGTDAFLQLKPEIGYYDQLDPQVLRQHILQAKAYGLSYFAFYWFWDNEPGEFDEWLNDGLESFLTVKDDPETYPGTTGFEFYLTLAQMPQDLRYADWPDGPVAKLVSYFSHPAYLKIGGRPVVHILDTRFSAIDDDELAIVTAGAPLSDGAATSNAENFIALLQVRTAAALGVHPIVLMSSELPYARAVGNSEGLSCLHPGAISWGPSSYATFTQGIQPFLTSSSTPKPMLPCVTSGFDERPREDIVWYLRPGPGGADPYPARYFLESNHPDVRLAYYSEALDQVKHWMDTHTDAFGLSRMLTIYAWNEWHEGGILESAMRCTARATGPQCPPGQPSCCLSEQLNRSFLVTTMNRLGLSTVP